MAGKFKFPSGRRSIKAGVRYTQTLLYEMSSLICFKVSLLAIRRSPRAPSSAFILVNCSLTPLLMNAECAFQEISDCLFMLTNKEFSLYNTYGRTYLFDLDFHHLKPDENDENYHDWSNKYTVDAYHAGNVRTFSFLHGHAIS